MSTFAKNMRRILVMKTEGADGLISHLSHLGCVVFILAEGAIHRGLANILSCHQRNKCNTLCPQGAECVDLVRRLRFRVTLALVRRQPQRQQAAYGRPACPQRRKDGAVS
jgi:hypothetical protein